jgi:quercetin dioxygenase-like cupin family protein
MVRVRKWDARHGVLTFDLLKALHEGSFHVARREFPPGARFPGRTRASAWYVLQGSCRLNIGGESLLSTGDVADVPAGNYTLEVGDEGVVLVQVWDLRPHMD